MIKTDFFESARPMCCELLRIIFADYREAVGLASVQGSYNARSRASCCRGWQSDDASDAL